MSVEDYLTQEVISTRTPLTGSDVVDASGFGAAFEDFNPHSPYGE